MTETQVWDLVTQTLARLEGKVDAGLAGLNSKLDSKADKSDLARLEGRIESTERRTAQVEQTEIEQRATVDTARRHERERIDRGNRRLIGVCTTLSTVALILSVVHP